MELCAQVGTDAANWGRKKVWASAELTWSALQLLRDGRTLM